MSDSQYVSSVSNKTNTTGVPQISSIKELENNPEYFPLIMAQMQNSNIGALLAAAAPVDSSDDSSSDNSFFGNSSGLSGSLGLSGLNISSDPISSAFASLGISSDLAFTNPTSTLQSFQVADTIQGLRDYSNATETKAWLDQTVKFVDPSDNLLKTGQVIKIDIENVNKPLFTISYGDNEEIELTLEDIKSLNSNNAAA